MYVRVVSKKSSEKFLVLKDANLSLTNSQCSSKSSRSKFLNKLKKLRNSCGDSSALMILLKKDQDKDKIGSKPDKNRKHGEDRKCQKQLQ
uniref:Uncharacterized protein n=1 Tax=Tanacetum cinerariifolium TaxID=118510 RepID=A0A699SID0_TANCI|nr:hypothetical protein [Tanacetum cinerariifolium]